jgi:hypothetical protein
VKTARRSRAGPHVRRVRFTAEGTVSSRGVAQLGRCSRRQPRRRCSKRVDSSVRSPRLSGKTLGRQEIWKGVAALDIGLGVHALSRPSPRRRRRAWPGHQERTLRREEGLGASPRRRAVSHGEMFWDVLSRIVMIRPLVARVVCYLMDHGWTRVEQQLQQDNGGPTVQALCRRCGASLVTCQDCDGTGYRRTCDGCLGSGRTPDEAYSAEPIGWDMNKFLQMGHGYIYDDGSCKACGGRGRTDTCRSCSATGKRLLATR